MVPRKTWVSENFNRISKSRKHFDKSRSLVFAWFVFTFFESRTFLPKSLGLGFLTRVSASRRVSDFTIRHPFYLVCFSVVTQRSSPLDQLKIKYNKAWLNTNLAKTQTEKHIASIHGNFTFTCIHALRLQKRGFLYETGFLPGSHPIWVLSVLLNSNLFRFPFKVRVIGSRLY